MANCLPADIPHTASILARTAAGCLAEFLILERSLVWQGGLDAMKLLGPFSKLLDGVVSDTFVQNWLNLLCFLLSGAALHAPHMRRTSPAPHERLLTPQQPIHASHTILAKI